MSPNSAKIIGTNSSSPPPSSPDGRKSNTTATASSSTATGLVSPFAYATAAPPPPSQDDNDHAHQNQIESDFSLPLTTPQVTSYRITHIEQARRRIKQSFLTNSPLLTTTTTNANTNSSSNATTTTSAAAVVECIFPRFDTRELVLGNVLGSGGFGTVLEVRGIRLLETQDEDQDDGTHNTAVDKKEGNEKQKQQQQQQQQQHCPSRIKCKSFDEQERPKKSPVVNNITRGILRTRAVSWRSNVKASSSNSEVHMLPDVAHFFHRGHHGHGHGHHKDQQPQHDGGSGIGRGTSREEKEEEQQRATNAEKEGGNDMEQVDHHAIKESPLMEQEQPQTVEHPPEDQPPPEQQQQQQPRQTTKRVRQISHNFSLQAWRDSDPGNEGDDAIPQEEMERYKSEYSSRKNTEHSGVTSSASATNAEKDETKVGSGDELCGAHQMDCLVNDVVVCPGTNLSTVLEQLQERSNSQFSIYETVGHATATENNDTAGDSQHQQQQQQQQQRKRIVFFQPATTTQHHHQSPTQQQQHKQYISENAYNTQTGESRYAIKIIQPSIVQNEFQKFIQAAMDMATETKFLSVLSHPNILKMRGVGQGDMFSPDYFLVLDRLYDTLLDRIEGQWRVLRDHLEHDFFVWSRTRKVKMLWAERMGVMRDIAGALAYMHDLGVIYRDIVSF